jgi:hypothetical protein
MPGLLVLAGGAEFQKGMEGADKFLIEQAGGSDAPIVILPTAGGAEAKVWQPATEWLGSSRWAGAT